MKAQIEELIIKWEKEFDKKDRFITFGKNEPTEYLAYARNDKYQIRKFIEDLKQLITSSARCVKGEVCLPKYCNCGREYKYEPCCCICEDDD